MKVVNLSEYRKAAAVKKTFPDTAPFYCKNCDCEDFKIYETGAVHCASCGALINNLAVRREA